MNFLSTNLKIALKALQILNFKKHLMTENTPYNTTTKEIKEYASMSEICNLTLNSPKLTGLFLCNNCLPYPC